jgi:cyclophilin family peptidyl-prolyl cis-trans isomerase
MKSRYLFLVLLLSLLPFQIGGCDQNKQSTEGKGKLLVTLETDKGTIVAELYPDLAPKTVENFQTLVNTKFYDGIRFHRVVPNFVVQAGDPVTKGEPGTDFAYQPGSGLPIAGTGGPGYTIPGEFSDKQHILGTFSMARKSDPDSGGSQFFICLGRQASLDNQYAVFGQVIEGIEVIGNIRQGDRIIKAFMGK